MRPAARLRKRREFADVYRRGRPFRNDLVVLRALRTNGPVSRFGFTPGRRRTAVVRNRIKRRLREAVRSLCVAPGWDMVLNARREAEDASYGELSAAVADLVRRAGGLVETVDPDE